jgi:hypothetical protein
LGNTSVILINFGHLYCVDYTIMFETEKSEPLQAALVSLASLGVVPGVTRNLRADSGRILGEIYDLILREVPAYTGSGNPDVLPELKQHLQLHIEETCRLLGGARSIELDFVRSHAHRRAEQKFPLDALLNAYRCIHKVFLRRIRDDALGAASESAHVRRVVAAVTEFTIEYTGAIGTLGTSEYVSQTRVLAEAEGDLRTELLNMLLSGYDESDNRAAQLLRRSGYLEQRQSFCVAVARSVDPREMENAARAQRMADALAYALRNTPVRTLISVRDGLVVAVLSGSRRQSGWTAPQSLLAERTYLPLRSVGPAALIGLSSDAPSTSHIPRALQEAKMALDFAHVAERVMPHSRIPFSRMLVRVARDSVQSVMPAWHENFVSADSKSRGSLLKTLKCYADNNMNVLQTAKVLSLHPNTIYARMQKIDDITGKNALGYHALTELLLAADLAD